MSCVASQSGLGYDRRVLGGIIAPWEPWSMRIVPRDRLGEFSEWISAGSSVWSQTGAVTMPSGMRRRRASFVGRPWWSRRRQVARGKREAEGQGEMYPEKRGYQCRSNWFLLPFLRGLDDDTTLLHDRWMGGGPDVCRGGDGDGVGKQTAAGTAGWSWAGQLSLTSWMTSGRWRGEACMMIGRPPHFRPLPVGRGPGLRAESA